MKAGDNSAREFPSTHWSAIERAGREDSQCERPALSDLLRRYLPALRAHLLMRRSVAPDQVDDVVQGFIAGNVLESDMIERADRTKGKFRTFILTALDRYVVSQRRHDKAEKRGGAHLTGSLDSECKATASKDGFSGSTDTFDVAWARQILREAIQRTRARCDRDGRADVWGVFESRILLPALHGTKPPDYSEIVERHAYQAPTQMWNAVRTGKAIFARQLRQVIGEYAESDEQIESELRDLHLICANLAQDSALIAYPTL
jgi:RNA polymerase sigma-70 factor (ECF subfamily)